MLEAQALRVLWMSQYEEAWAHLQPGMRKGNPRAIEVGSGLPSGRRSWRASICRRKWRSGIPMANGIPLYGKLKNLPDEPR